MKMKCSGIGTIEDNLWQCATQELKGCLEKPASVICESKRPILLEVYCSFATIVKLITWLIPTEHKMLQLRGNASNVCSGRLEMEEGRQWKPVEDLNGRPDEWCRQMHCGTNVSQPQSDGWLTCTGGSTTAMFPKPTSISFKLKHRVSLSSDRVHVSLWDNGKPSRCYGAVQITVNGSTRPVCGSTWDRKAGEVVCKELDCGKVRSSFH